MVGSGGMVFADPLADGLDTAPGHEVIDQAITAPTDQLVFVVAERP